MRIKKQDILDANTLEKKIKGFPYLVTNTGFIFTKPRTYYNSLGVRITIPKRVRKPRTNKIEPHLFVDLSAVRDDVKVRKSAYIHLEVMLAFGTPKPKGVHYVHHKDGNYSNNHIDNMQWITPAELISMYQPKRLADPTKSWRTRRRIYGSNGMGKKNERKVC